MVDNFPSIKIVGGFCFKTKSLLGFLGFDILFFKIFFIIFYTKLKMSWKSMVKWPPYLDYVKYSNSINVLMDV